MPDVEQKSVDATTGLRDGGSSVTTGHETDATAAMLAAAVRDLPPVQPVTEEVKRENWNPLLHHSTNGKKSGGVLNADGRTWKRKVGRPPGTGPKQKAAATEEAFAAANLEPPDPAVAAAARRKTCDMQMRQAEMMLENTFGPHTKLEPIEHEMLLEPYDEGVAKGDFPKPKPIWALLFAVCAVVVPKILSRKTGEYMRSKKLKPAPALRNTNGQAETTNHGSD